MATDQIKTLLLDIGGVLLTNGWGREERQTAIEKFKLDQKELDDRHALVWDTYESGRLTLADYLKFVIFYTERTFTPEEFTDFMKQCSKPIPGAIAFFKELKATNKYKVVALSNEVRELNAYRIEAFKLNELFDFYISSCYVGLRKPDPKMYYMACDTSQTLAEHTLYIDDRLPYIEMARSYGIPSLHYKGLDTARAFFKPQ